MHHLFNPTALANGTVDTESNLISVVVSSGYDDSTSGTGEDGNFYMFANEQLVESFGYQAGVMPATEEDELMFYYTDAMNNAGVSPMRYGTPRTCLSRSTSYLFSPSTMTKMSARPRWSFPSTRPETPSGPSFATIPTASTARSGISLPEGSSRNVSTGNSRPGPSGYSSSRSVHGCNQGFLMVPFHFRFKWHS